jgi:acetyl-CoA acetyltransferase
VPFLLSAARSPFVPAGDAFGRWHPVDLAGHIANAALINAELDAEDIDEIWVGCEEPVGAQGADMARAIVVSAVWPDQICGTVLERGETSGTAALHAAAAAIASGQVKTAMVLGVHSASAVTPGASALGRNYGRPWGDGPAARFADDGGLLPAPRQAEATATGNGIDRAAQDAWARRSHERRATAVPPWVVPTDTRPAEGTAVQRGTTITRDFIRRLPIDLADLPPMFDESGTITSGSIAPPADGLSAIILSRGEGSDGARLVGTARAAGHPRDPIGGLHAAVTAALRDADLTTEAITDWHLAERTAAGALLACRRLIDLGVDRERINPHGGSLAVGDAGAADDLRLSIDGIGASGRGDTIAAVSYGMTGAAVSVWTRQ